MNDFQKPIHRKDGTPYEPIRVSGIEKDKKGKEEFNQANHSSKPMAFAIIVSFFKKFLSLFASKEHSESLFFDQQQMAQDVAAFKKLLQILQQEDQSHSPEYAQQLSKLWHNLLDHCNPILARRGQLPESFVKLKNLINSVSHYPAGADHPLGYYLTEYAGKDWIPFPFMEILQELHREGGVLLQWIADLDEVL